MEIIYNNVSLAVRYQKQNAKLSPNWHLWREEDFIWNHQQGLEERRGVRKWLGAKTVILIEMNSTLLFSLFT